MKIRHESWRLTLPSPSWTQEEVQWLCLQEEFKATSFLKGLHLQCFQQPWGQGLAFEQGSIFPLPSVGRGLAKDNLVVQVGWGFCFDVWGGSRGLCNCLSSQTGRFLSGWIILETQSWWDKPFLLFSYYLYLWLNHYTTSLSASYFVIYTRFVTLVPLKNPG